MRSKTGSPTPHKRSTAAAVAAMLAMPRTWAPGRQKGEYATPDWSCILARFQAGETKAQIIDSGACTPKQWNGRMGRDAELRAAINAEHERRRLAKINVRDWEGAIKLYDEGIPVLEIAARPNMPDPNQWNRRLATDPAFKARVAGLRQGAAYQRERERRDGQAWASYHHTIAIRSAPGAAFRILLGANALYAAARAEISRNIEAHIRDDVVSELVLFAIEHGLGPDALKGKGRDFLRRYHRENMTYRMISLDEPVYDDSRRKETWTDTLASDVAHF
jgi:hypothetical protein